MVLKHFLALGLCGVLFAQERTLEQFATPTVEVKKVRTAHTQKLYGYVVPSESHIYEVAPRFEGYVEKLFVTTRYAKVKKGDPLATVYSPKISLLKEKFVQSFRYKQQEVVKEARERLEVFGIAKEELDLIEKNKVYTDESTIYAPYDGTVFVKNITHGSAFKEQQVLFKIVDLSKVWVEAAVPQEKLPLISSVKHFELAFKATPAKATSQTFTLYPNITPQEATATLRIELANPKEALFPGMFASVDAVFSPLEALVVPKGALIFKNDSYYAFVATAFQGEFEPVKVSAKPLDSHRMMVISGLEEGDSIAYGALFMMDADAQINVLY